MNRSAAVARARKWAKKKETFTFVFLEDANLDDYVVGDEFDAENFYAGLTPVYCFGPDGEWLE